MKPMRTIIVDGKRYRVSPRSFDMNFDIGGPGLVGGVCIRGDDGIDLRSDEMKVRVQDAVRKAKENNRIASENLQKRIHTVGTLPANCRLSVSRDG